MSGLILPGAATPVDDEERQLRMDAARLRQEMRDNHRARRETYVMAIESLLLNLKAANALSDAPTVNLTIKAHPQDFQLLAGRHPEAVNVAVLNSRPMKFGADVVDLVLYRTFDHTLAFGYTNVRYIPEGTPAFCVTMRAQRFVDEMVPDEAFADQNLRDQYAQFDALVTALANLLRPEESGDEGSGEGIGEELGEEV